MILLSRPRAQALLCQGKRKASNVLVSGQSFSFRVISLIWANPLSLEFFSLSLLAKMASEVGGNLHNLCWGGVLRLSLCCCLGLYGLLEDLQPRGPRVGADKFPCPPGPSWMSWSQAASESPHLLHPTTASHPPSPRGRGQTPASRSLPVFPTPDGNQIASGILPHLRQVGWTGRKN